MQREPRSTARRKPGLIVLATTAGAFTIFLSLLTLVRSKPQLNSDLTMTMRLQRRQHPLLARAMNWISWPGFRPQSLILPGVAVGAAWLIRGKRDALFLAAAWMVSMVSYTTKLLVRRPRPAGHGILVVKADLRDSSFPSGHTLHYTVFWGFAAYLWVSTVRSPWLRWLPAGVIAGLVALVGPSRVYLGHHWLTDVLGSYSLGTGCLLALIEAHRLSSDE